MNSGLASALSGKQDLYMKLLMAQLRNQDPMEPMTNSEMVSQMAQLATLDSINNLNASFSDVLNLYRLGSGTGLIGRQVTYFWGSQLESGTVESISLGNEALKLQLLGGREIALSEVTRVS